MVQDEEEDAGLLAQVKDDNEVMHQPPRRTCLDICLVCYNSGGLDCDNVRRNAWRHVGGRLRSCGARVYPLGG